MTLIVVFENCWKMTGSWRKHPPVVLFLCSWPVFLFLRVLDPLAQPLLSFEKRFGKTVAWENRPKRKTGSKTPALWFNTDFTWTWCARWSLNECKFGLLRTVGSFPHSVVGAWRPWWLWWEPSSWLACPHVSPSLSRCPTFLSPKWVPSLWWSEYTLSWTHHFAWSWTHRTKNGENEYILLGTPEMWTSNCHILLILEMSQYFQKYLWKKIVLIFWLYPLWSTVSYRFCPFLGGNLKLFLAILQLLEMSIGTLKNFLATSRFRSNFQLFLPAFVVPPSLVCQKLNHCRRPSCIRTSGTVTWGSPRMFIRCTWALMDFLSGWTIKQQQHM